MLMVNAHSQENLCKIHLNASLKKSIDKSMEAIQGALKKINGGFMAKQYKKAEIPQ